MTDEQIYFGLFDLPNEAGEYHVPSWPLYRCEETIRLVKAKAQSYGVLPSISAYIRAFGGLRAEGLIKPVRSTDPLKITGPVVTKESYERMSASEVRRRYAQEPEFRAEMDHLLATGQI